MSLLTPWKSKSERVILDPSDLVCYGLCCLHFQRLCLAKRDEDGDFKDSMVGGERVDDDNDNFKVGARRRERATRARFLFLKCQMQNGHIKLYTERFKKE
ncbi:hypothetical protein CIPAW_05G158200 [Carya illinoinensis]|uniref:Uncharacterized protein n=1 Tax=Carya illinoinensis TaxID=32201 RepID=A0A8T1QKH4_CARIL|nr:hypothetical protein CIPAW_05G158200 [Carya illinoinensis]